MPHSYFLYICFIFAFWWFNSILSIQWGFDLCLVLWSTGWDTNTTRVQNEHVSRSCLVQWFNALDESFALSIEPLGPALHARICTPNCIILPSLARCQVLFFLYPCNICFYFLWFQMPPWCYMLTFGLTNYFDCIKVHIGVEWPLFCKLWHKGLHQESGVWIIWQSTK